MDLITKNYTDDPAQLHITEYDIIYILLRSNSKVNNRNAYHALITDRVTLHIHRYGNLLHVMIKRLVLIYLCKDIQKLQAFFH